MGFLNVPRWATKAMSTARTPLPTTKLAPPSPLYQLIPSSPNGATSISDLASDDSESTFGGDPDDFGPDHLSSHPRPRSVLARLDPLAVSVVLVAIGMFIAMFVLYPFPTTIHAFVAIALGVVSWSILSWARILIGVVLRKSALYRYSTPHMTGLIVATIMTVYWLVLGVRPPAEALPADFSTDGERYFIAANLYNSESLLPRWTGQLEQLISYLGPNNTFVSVYESNSHDQTPAKLQEFAQELESRGVQHRILSDTTDRWWPYGTSPERIGFLANARNRVMEPLQSSDANVRLDDYDSYTKVLFLNDVLFAWESAVRLLGTKLDNDSDYDLACGLDFGASGLYDTWVARDICGTPARPFWPYVKDEQSIARVREDKPFQVAACWNGMVAFPTRHHLYKPPSKHEKRVWKMIDKPSYPGYRASPELQDPIQFRTSGIDACDHSECFLFSYDLYRLYEEGSGGPKIVMNPTVQTAYEDRWYKWNNVVLRIPMIKWWRDHWSHGLPFDLVDWIWEHFGRQRDVCTWSAFEKHMPERCPKLPESNNQPWYVG